MNIGLSTYAYQWHVSAEAEKPWTLGDIIRSTADLGAELLQICDFAPISQMDPSDLAALRSAADEANVTLELGTKGIHPDHLARYLEIAEALDARILRTMLKVPGHEPAIGEASGILRDLLPQLERQGVQLAIETYEQVPTVDIVGLVAALDNPHIGICSDPANTVAILETPKEVIDLVAPYVVNMHVKDFAFSRKDRSIGFTLAGAPLGEGLLPYDYMIDKIKPAERGISQIIEHWLPWQGTEAETLAMELEWTRHNLEFLRSR